MEVLNGRNPGLPEDGKSGNKENNKWLSRSLVLFARFSSWILAPVIIGTILGKWLESKSGENGQLIFLAVIGASFIISITGLIIEVSKEYAKIEKEQKSKKDRGDSGPDQSNSS
jgi:hypothetical protein